MNSTSDNSSHATTATIEAEDHPLGGDPPTGSAVGSALVLPVLGGALELVVLAAQTGPQALGAGAVELVRALFEIARHGYAYSDGMPGRRTIGVDMGGSKLLAGAVDSGLSVHHRAQRSFTRHDVSYLFDTVVDAVEETRAGAGGEVAAVGFGIPSLIDQRTGTAVVAVNLPLKNVMFGDVMAERLDLPVFVDNDANLAALAEHRAGAARGFNEAVVLTVGTGIGGGLILRGELYRGAIGSAGELGSRRNRSERPAVWAQLPEPRVRRGDGVGHRAGARGAAGRARASALGARTGARRRTASSPDRSSPSSPTTATTRRSRRSRRSAAISALLSPAS